MKRWILTLLALITLTACGTVHREAVTADNGQMVVASIQEHGEFQLDCYGPDGKLKWSENQRANALANEGEYSILDTYFRGAIAPTGYYLRLYNATPGLTSTLLTLSASEPATANGYNPATQGLAKNTTDWPTLSLVFSHYEVTSKTITITASGGTIGPVTYAAVTTTSDNTGKLVAYAPLSATRTLNAGDSLQMTYKVRLQ